MASIGSGRRQRRHPLPQVVRNKIGTHPVALPPTIVEREAGDWPHSETIGQSIERILPISTVCWTATSPAISWTCTSRPSRATSRAIVTAPSW